MMSSTYYSNLISKYEGVKSKINGVLKYFDGCTTSLREASSYMEQLIINDEVFDKGEIKQSINKLSVVESNLKSLIDECNIKIEEYTNLYKKALAQEKNQSSDGERVSSMKKNKTAGDGNTSENVRVSSNKFNTMKY